MDFLSLTFFNYALWLLIVFSAIITFSLFFINAPYGRYFSKKWGWAISNKTGWVLMETPAVFVILYFFVTGRHTVVGLVFIIMWQSHYLYRTYIFPFRLKKPKKNMPFSILVMAVIFNVWNGYLSGIWLFHLSFPKSLDWFYSWQFILGLVLFYSGMFINRQSDKILFNLRKQGQIDYKIPYGGLYKYISMPSYLGEIVQWAGFAIATFSMSGLVFTIFTIANLLPRAVSNHKWYEKTFKNYPKNRRAIIPFIL